MKKSIFLFFSILTIAVGSTSYGQDQTSPTVVAVFNGNNASLEKEIDSKTVVFTLKNLDENSRANFENKAKIYSIYFTVYYPSVIENKTSQVYTLTLIGKTQIKMLNRLFISANINRIEFNGKKMSRDDFFKPYMN